MQQLVERGIDAQGRIGGPAGRRSVTINLAESPLSWLGARGLVTARQIEAGERLRGDYERASIAPSITMRWAARVDGGGGEGADPTTAHLAARRRFDAAIAWIGPGLSDVAWRVICAGEGLPGGGARAGMASALGPRRPHARARSARRPLRPEVTACRPPRPGR